jgi:predicted glycoside hydrolase/deacetylase ChbG (UPF0249 family)
MPARLIINADDFGLTTGTNHGVEELHRAGVLTSATMMATGAAFDDAVRIALRNPALGVGCHIVLVDDIPISHPQSIPTLLGADGKTFRPSLLDFIQALLRGTISRADISREIQAQIQKLQRAGIDVTHVDTHKHTHLFPAVAGPLLHIAQRCGVGAVRNPFGPATSSDQFKGAPLGRKISLQILNGFKPGFLKLPQLKQGEILTTDGTLGIGGTGTMDAAAFREILQALTSSEENGLYELLCHPGYNDAALDQITTRLRESRNVERHALRKVVPEILAQPNAPELIHYGNLGVTGLQRASGQYCPNTGYEKVL